MRNTSKLFKEPVYIMPKFQSLKNLAALAYQKMVYDSATIQCVRKMVESSIRW